MNLWSSIAKKYKLNTTGKTAKLAAALNKAKINLADLSPKDKPRIKLKRLKGEKLPSKKNMR